MDLDSTGSELDRVFDDTIRLRKPLSNVTNVPNKTTPMKHGIKDIEVKVAGNSVDNRKENMQSNSSGGYNSQKATVCQDIDASRGIMVNGINYIEEKSLITTRPSYLAISTKNSEMITKPGRSILFDMSDIPRSRDHFNVECPPAGGRINAEVSRTGNRVDVSEIGNRVHVEDLQIVKIGIMQSDKSRTKEEGEIRMTKGDEKDIVRREQRENTGARQVDKKRSHKGDKIGKGQGMSRNSNLPIRLTPKVRIKATDAFNPFISVDKTLYENSEQVDHFKQEASALDTSTHFNLHRPKFYEDPLSLEFSYSHKKPLSNRLNLRNIVEGTNKRVTFLDQIQSNKNDHLQEQDGVHKQAHDMGIEREHAKRDSKSSVNQLDRDIPKVKSLSCMADVDTKKEENTTRKGWYTDEEGERYSDVGKDYVGVRVQERYNDINTKGEYINDEKKRYDDVRKKCSSDGMKNENTDKVGTKPEAGSFPLRKHPDVLTEKQDTKPQSSAHIILDSIKANQKGQTGLNRSIANATKTHSVSNGLAAQNDCGYDGHAKTRKQSRGENEAKIRDSESNRAVTLEKIQEEFNILKETHRRVLQTKNKILKIIDQEVSELSRKYEKEKALEIQKIKELTQKQVDEVRKESQEALEAMRRETELVISSMREETKKNISEARRMYKDKCRAVIMKYKSNLEQMVVSYIQEYKQKLRNKCMKRSSNKMP